MAQRAGRALREKWADEARYAETERRHPGYHARHWRAHELRSAISQRYGAALLAQAAAEGRAVGAEDVARMVAAQERLRVVERPGGVFVVTSGGER